MWWAWVLFIISIIMSAAAGGMKFFLKDAAGIIEQKIKNGEELYCQFCVQDKQTKQDLIYGDKMRKIENLVFDRKVYKYGFIPEYQYLKDMEFCGRECQVIFCVSAKMPKKNYEYKIVLTTTASQLLQNTEETKAIFNEIA